MTEPEDYFGAPHPEVGYSLAHPAKGYPLIILAAMRLVTASEDRPPVTCRVCGAQRRSNLWTLVVPFRSAALVLDAAELATSGQVCRAFDPVCVEHPVVPLVSAAGEFERTLHYFLGLARAAHNRPEDDEPLIVVAN